MRRLLAALLLVSGLASAQAVRLDKAAVRLDGYSPAPVAASDLKSATTTVNVSAAAAPSLGKVLTATSSTAATWQSPSVGSPAGSDTYVQFNDGGALGGNAGLTFTKASAALSGTGPWTLTPVSDFAPLTVRASASPGTAHIVQWQTSSNGALGHIAHDGSVTVPNLTDSGLTATRVPYAGAAGLLSDAAALTFTVGTGTLAATNVSAAENLTGMAVLGSRSKVISDGNPVAFATFTIADGAVASGEILYAVKSVKTTALQVLCGRVRFAATREGSTYTVSIAEVGTQALAAAAGTLTGGISIAAAAGVVTFTATFDTNQSAPDFVTIFYRFESPDALTIAGL